MRGGSAARGMLAPMPKIVVTKQALASSRRVESILAGAARVFGRKGFAPASMREVAEECGASLGAIYHHFPGKDAILHAILCENFERVGESLERRLVGVEDPRRQIEIFVTNHVEFFARHLDEMRVMSHELDTLTGGMGEDVAQHRRAYAQRARQILSRLRPRMPKAELQLATLSLFGMLNWTYRWFHTLPRGTDAAALGERMAALFLDGFAPRRRADGRRPGAR